MEEQMEDFEVNKNLVICKHCGAQIAKTAKTCPICGGRNKKPLLKRVWFWLLIIGVIYIGALVVSYVNYLYDDEYDKFYHNYYEMSEEEFKNACTSVTFEDLSRNPNEYYGNNVKVTGEVFQKISDNGEDAEYLVSITPEGNEYYTYYTNQIYVWYYYDDADKMIEDDIVTIYGIGDNEYTYETVSGKVKTVPAIEAIYVEFE